MAATGRLYVVGPPTPVRESIPILVRDVLSRSKIGHEEYTLEDVEGPVPFHSAWMEGGRQNPIRTGMAALELWTGVVKWRSTTSATSLSALVMDGPWVADRKYDRPPTFETFVVSILRDDQSGVEKFYNWHVRYPDWWASRCSWRNRATWLTNLADDSDRRRNALETLHGASWRALYDLDGLFRHPNSMRLSRRGGNKSTSPPWRDLECQETPELRRRDTFVPSGLDKFLASVAPRPSSYEQLSRELWTSEENGGKRAPMGAYYRDTCITAHVTNPDTTQRWWWKSTIAVTGSTVNQMKECVTRSRGQRVPATAVKGLSFRNSRTLRRSPTDRTDHEVLVDDCRKHGIPLVAVDLGCGRTSIFRGFDTGDYVPSNPTEASCDDDIMFPNQAQRLVHVKWFIVSTTAPTRVLKEMSTIHYIERFDSKKLWFLFQEDVVVTYPAQTRVSVSVVFGPWAGHGPWFFKIAGNREKAIEAAIHVQKILPVKGLLSRLSYDHGEGGTSLTLGGPGIGKTKVTVTECTKYVLEKTNRRAMIVAPLKSVRNLLTSNLVEAGFRRHMRVIGTSGLDDLAKSLTLPELVWQRMKDRVQQHERRLTELHSAASRVAALGMLRRRKFPSVIAHMVDGYGEFTATLVAMHRVVAMERCAIEQHVKDIKKDVIAATPVLVLTAGSLFRSSAMREISKDAGKLGLLLLEESTRISKFDADMLIASVKDIVDEATRLALIADPCQTKASLRGLDCTSSLSSADEVNVSLVSWALDRIIREEVDAHSFVERTNLVNRYRKGRRCRKGACRVVNALAPLALPGKRAFWNTMVGQEKVWADLKPRDPENELDAFLCAKTKEIVSVQPVPHRWLGYTNVSTFGFHGRSRYDADTALYAALSAVYMGIRLRELRRTPYAELAAWGIDEKTARTWASEPEQVTIVGVHQAMVNLCQEAVAFVRDAITRYSPQNIQEDAKENNLTVTCVCGDSVQGETFGCMVLALPPSTKQWSKYIREPTRMLTVLSRYSRVLVVPYVRPDGITNATTTCKETVQAFMDLQYNADETVSFEQIMSFMGWRSPHDNKRWWTSWLRKAHRLNHTPNTPEDASHELDATWRAVTASPAEVPLFPSPTSYRGHRLLMLRFIGSMLRMLKENPEFQEGLTEIMFHVGERRTVVGLRMDANYEEWFEQHFMTGLNTMRKTTYSGADGALLSLIPEPIPNGNAHLLSAVVHGIGRRYGSMWSLGGMEWLAFQLVVEARRVLLEPKNKKNDTLWEDIEKKCGTSRADIDVGIAFSPHKMRLSGDVLESSAPGAGERSDVWLLAYPRHASHATALGSAYHTTNVFAGTASLRDGQSYPESRILWRPYVALANLMEQAACNLARVFDLPSPESVDKVLLSEAWIEAKAWSKRILSPEAEPVTESAEQDATGTENNSDTDEPEW